MEQKHNKQTGKVHLGFVSWNPSYANLYNVVVSDDLSPVLMDQLLQGGPSVSEAKDMGSPDKDSKVNGGGQLYLLGAHLPKIRWQK